MSELMDGLRELFSYCTIVVHCLVNIPRAVYGAHLKAVYILNPVSVKYDMDQCKQLVSVSGVECLHTA